jgi:hypothetical protein
MGGLALVFMKITDDQFQALSSHFVIQGRKLPPQRVYWAVASLVSDPARIKASLRSFKPGAPTVWRVYLLTDAALVAVTIEFTEEHYTRETENRRGVAAQSPYKLTEAWVRPLDNITSYSTTNVRGTPAADWLEVATRLTFRGLDAPVELPLASLTDTAEDQKRSDQFLKALRESIAWLG